MKVALDTNVMAYAEAVNGLELQEQATAALARHIADDIVTPVQALAELFGVLVRKAGEAPGAAQRPVGRWSELHEPVPTTAALLHSAMALVT